MDVWHGIGRRALRPSPGALHWLSLKDRPGIRRYGIDHLSIPISFSTDGD